MHSQRRGFTPHIAPLVALLLISSGGDVWGQEPEWIRLGTLVRVTTDSELPRQVVGVLAGHTADSVFIIPERAGDPTGFALMEITRLEINLKRETHSRTGARVGFVVALVGGVAYSLAQGDAESLIAGAALFSAVCVPAGAIIGHSLKTETWADITLSEATVMDVPTRPYGATIRVSLRL